LQNILRENEKWNAQIKLVDFGLGTRFIGACPLKTRCGTLYATAPEVLRESYDEKCDIWSAGVVAFTLLSGRKPFEALVLYPASGEDEDGKASVMANILMGRCHYRHRDWKRVSFNAMDFTKKMMTQDYTKRWSAQQALEHSWFNEDGDAYGSDDEEGSDHERAPAESHRQRKFSSTSIMSDGSNEANMVQLAMKNLKRQADSSVIHQTSMLAVAYNMPLSKTADRRAFFQSFDVDKNGTLSKEEFRNAMLACNIFSPDDTGKLTTDDIDCIFHSVDVNGDNQISFTEFLAATLDPRDFDIQSLNSAFQLMDTDRKGTLHDSAPAMMKYIDLLFH
jgi:calcium-dependent protein kinase